MTQIALQDRTGGLLLPALLLAGLVGVIGTQTGFVGWPVFGDPRLAPHTTTIKPQKFMIRATGEYQQNRVTIDAPLVEVMPARPLEIMTYQVSALDYARCVADAACKAADPRRRDNGEVPVTGVSFNDATDYAAWLSANTGATWRLPTVEEWSFAAGRRAVDPALGVDTNTGNPADRWIAFYEKEAALGEGALATPAPLGTFGFNENGVADIAGTVWEWTASCDSRTTLDAVGAVTSRIDSCGVRLLEGRHRTPMSAFIRDARSGGCSTGAPPDNLGFRLVRERNFFGL
jgi:formylglycine-generating enzyme required for sulfatase activity